LLRGLTATCSTTTSVWRQSLATWCVLGQTKVLLKTGSTRTNLIADLLMVLPSVGQKRQRSLVLHSILSSLSMNINVKHLSTRSGNWLMSFVVNHTMGRHTGTTLEIACLRSTISLLFTACY
ncbi:hypothetical protein GGI19_006901, partial [Coemansia pectinata]